MADENETISEFTHVGVKKRTQRQINLLVSIRGGKIYEMVGEWADVYWAQALENGLVTDKMLNAHFVGESPATKVLTSKSRSKSKKEAV